MPRIEVYTPKRSAGVILDRPPSRRIQQHCQKAKVSTPSLSKMKFRNGSNANTLYQNILPEGFILRNQRQDTF